MVNVDDHISRRLNDEDDFLELSELTNPFSYQI